MLPASVPNDTPRGAYWVVISAPRDPGPSGPLADPSGKGFSSKVIVVRPGARASNPAGGATPAAANPCMSPGRVTLRPNDPTVSAVPFETPTSKPEIRSTNGVGLERTV